jgi:ChrR-like protein with cupin domain
MEPTFRHLDDPDVAWQSIKEQRNADGSVSHVWEKWLSFSSDPPYLSLYAKYDPGMVVRRHGHYSPHVVFVLGGEVSIGERRCPAGTHVELPLGAAFGPIVAGPDGAVMFEVMMGDPRSWGDDPEAFESALAAQGADALPDPPLEFPAWISDLRAQWGESPAAT